MVARNQALLEGLALDHLLCVEIGPLDRPIITRAMGRVLYVDHLDTDGLRAKYAEDADVRTDALAAIDWVWGAQGLPGLDGLVRRHGAPDYVIASHVIEHVPDLIGWLAAVGRALAPGGEIRLVVPDKRFCFDHHRAESTLADLLAAHVSAAAAPPLARIADYFLHVVDLDPAEAWAGRPPPPPVIDAGRYAWAESVCRDVRETGRYQDVHCWVATPRSFCLLLADLVAFGALALECTMFRDTERGGLEFLLGLRVSEDKARAEASWRAAATRAVAVPDGPQLEGPHRESRPRSWLRWLRLG